MAIDAPFRGGKLRPFWQILTPQQPWDGTGVALVLGAGPGFGTGGHPTTQLCMHAIAAFAPPSGQSWRVLDFGSGTGILSIAAAKLGARVEAVEIDLPAVESARANAGLNACAAAIHTTQFLTDLAEPFDMVVANILRSILLEFAEALTARLAPQGTLILSGLVGTDLPELTARYAALLDGRRPEVYQQGDWRALVWRPKKR